MTAQTLIKELQKLVKTHPDNCEHIVTKNGNEIRQISIAPGCIHLSHGDCPGDNITIFCNQR